jgi:hypothetical protein
MPPVSTSVPFPPPPTLPPFVFTPSSVPDAATLAQQIFDQAQREIERVFSQFVD